MDTLAQQLAPAKHAVGLSCCCCLPSARQLLVTQALLPSSHVREQSWLLILCMQATVFRCSDHLASHARPCEPIGLQTKAKLSFAVAPRTIGVWLPAPFSPVLWTWRVVAGCWPVR